MTNTIAKIESMRVAALQREREKHEARIAKEMARQQVREAKIETQAAARLEKLAVRQATLEARRLVKGAVKKALKIVQVKPTSAPPEPDAELSPTSAEEPHVDPPDFHAFSPLPTAHAASPQNESIWDMVERLPGCVQSSINGFLGNHKISIRIVGRRAIYTRSEGGLWLAQYAPWKVDVCEIVDGRPVEVTYRGLYRDRHPFVGISDALYEEELIGGRVAIKPAIELVRTRSPEKRAQFAWSRHNEKIQYEARIREQVRLNRELERRALIRQRREERRELAESMSLFPELV